MMCNQIFISYYKNAIVGCNLKRKILECVKNKKIKKGAIE